RSDRINRGQRILAQLHGEQTLDRRRQTGRRTPDGVDRADARRVEETGVKGDGELRSDNCRRDESQTRRRRAVPPDRRARAFGIQYGKDRRLGAETARTDRELGERTKGQRRRDSPALSSRDALRPRLPVPGGAGFHQCQKPDRRDWRKGLEGLPVRPSLLVWRVEDLPAECPGGSWGFDAGRFLWDHAALDEDVRG